MYKRQDIHRLPQVSAFYRRVLGGVIETVRLRGLLHAHGDQAVSYTHLRGWGAEKDEAQAVEWFRKAADQDYAEAQYQLGKCYYYGWGVKTVSYTHLPPP